MTCPSGWNIARNDTCWRKFPNVQLTWKAAHVLCLQHDSRLANLSEISNINITMSGEVPYWINDAKAWPPREPLEDWFWVNGKKYSGNHSQRFSGNMTKFSSKEACAMIRDLAKGILEDESCNELHPFVCQKNRGDITVIFRNLSL